MRADALRRRNTIIATASRLFQEHGSTVTLEKIAEESGVGIATLYRNFSSKPELIRACSEYLGREFLAFQEEMISGYTPGADHLRTYANKLRTMGLNILIPAFVPSDLEELDPELKTLGEKLMSHGDKFIRLGQQHGEIGPGVTHFEFIVGLLALARPRAVHVEAFEPDIEEHMVDLYLAGIRAGHAG